MIGLTSFIAYVRVDDLTDYSKNHYDLIDPTGPNASLSIVENCNLIFATPLADYNTYTLSSGQLIKIDSDLIAENKQFIILVNKSNPALRVVDLYAAVDKYLTGSVKNFWSTSKEITFKNIKYIDYLFDLLPFCKPATKKAGRNPATLPGVEASSSSTTGPGPSTSSTSPDSESSSSSPAVVTSPSSASSKSSYDHTSLTSRTTNSTSSDNSTNTSNSTGSTGSTSSTSSN